MPNAIEKIYRQKLQEVAREYEAGGYRVVIDPAPSELPGFLKKFHPDLIAFGPRDSVVIEVKIGTRSTSSERYSDLAQIVNQQPGWRFSLLIVDLSSEEIPPSIAPPLDRKGIEDRLREADELMKQGAKDAAFLLLWSSFEAALRRLAYREQLPLERMPSTALLKELFSLGLVSRHALDVALRAYSVRNSLVHGFETKGLEDTYNEMASPVHEALTELEAVGA
jgi:hypothetical protein